jgi:hypothetical protein
MTGDWFQVAFVLQLCQKLDHSLLWIREARHVEEVEQFLNSDKHPARK